jgi:hypothetical protein
LMRWFSRKAARFSAFSCTAALRACTIKRERQTSTHVGMMVDFSCGNVFPVPCPVSQCGPCVHKHMYIVSAYVWCMMIRSLPGLLRRACP